MLRLTHPPLTFPMAPGVAFAEDPGPDFSFGQDRCNALAPAVLALLDDDRQPLTAGIDMFKEALRAARIDPERPWLCPIQ